MTPVNAAKFAGVEPAVISRWLSLGILPFRKTGGGVRVERDDVLGVMVDQGLTRRPATG